MNTQRYEMTSKRWQPHLYLLLLLIFPFSPLCAVEQVEIFELKAKTPREMIPLTQPFVGPQGSVQGMHNQLIVRTDPDRMASIREIISRFDQPSRQLEILVRRTAPTQMSREQLGIAGKIDTGNATHGYVTMHGHRYTTEETDEITQKLRTLEGEPALLMTGVDRPVLGPHQIISGAVVAYSEEPVYQRLSNGFYVTPYLLADHQVRLDISTEYAEPGPGAETLDQGSQHSITVPLDTWVGISANARVATHTENDVGLWASTQKNTASAYWVYVTLLP